jgi:Tol biopolymer transport system component
MRNRRKALLPLLLTIVCLIFVFGNLNSQESAAEYFEKAFYYEDVQGDLQKAIDLYKQILEKFPKNREVAAKAQLHIGLCFEKLGLTEAQKAFQKVVDNYPDQTEAVKSAKERIARLAKVLETVTSKPKFKKIQIPVKLARGAQLSPDGKKLTFSSTMYEGSIWTVPVPGKVGPDIAGKPEKLIGEDKVWAWGHVWSADGKWIAYNYMKNDKEKGIFVDEVHVISSSGGEPTMIAVPVNRGGSFHLFQYSLSLSPDGKILAYASKEEGKSDKPKESYIYTIPVNGGVAKRLTGGRTWLPAFSPDGKKIAYVKAHTPEEGPWLSDVWVIQNSGGRPTQISDLAGRARDPVWSPDGKWIAFLREPKADEGSKEICIVPESGTSNPTTLPTRIELPLEASLRLAGWTRDNKIGLLLRKPVHRAIYTVKSSGGKATQVTPGEGWESSPGWSPDGKRIFFQDEKNTCSVPAEGGKVSVIPIAKIQDGAVKSECVSPDGEKIVFIGRKKGDTEWSLWTVPVDGGEPAQITASPLTDAYPCWSPDGKSIAFMRQEKTSDGKSVITNLFSVPVAGGAVMQLTSGSDKDEPKSKCKWSPAGKLISYISTLTRSIKVIPVEGGESKVVAELEQGRRAYDITWSPDGRKIAYTSNEGIFIVSLDGGEPAEVKTGLDAEAFHIAWSTDGEKIAFAASKGGELELWLMENFLPQLKDKK